MTPIAASICICNPIPEVTLGIQFESPSITVDHFSMTGGYPGRVGTLRSPYTLDRPPPSQPPNGVLCPSLWPVQVRWWLRHTPKSQSRTCAVCDQAWPCHSWACWDGQLADALATAQTYRRQQHQQDSRRVTHPQSESEPLRIARQPQSRPVAPASTTRV